MPDVSYESAYGAAMVRTHKLTDALVLADARVMELERELAGARQSERDADKRYDMAHNEAADWRRRYFRLARSVGAAEDQEDGEVGCDGAQTCGDAAAECEAVRPADVPG